MLHQSLLLGFVLLWVPVGLAQEPAPAPSENPAAPPPDPSVPTAPPPGPPPSPSTSNATGGAPSGPTPGPAPPAPQPSDETPPDPPPAEPVPTNASPEPPQAPGAPPAEPQSSPDEASPTDPVESGSGAPDDSVESIVEEAEGTAREGLASLGGGPGTLTTFIRLEGDQPVVEVWIRTAVYQDGLLIGYTETPCLGAPASDACAASTAAPGPRPASPFKASHAVPAGSMRVHIGGDVVVLPSLAAASLQPAASASFLGAVLGLGRTGIAGHWHRAWSAVGSVARGTVLRLSDAGPFYPAREEPAHRPRLSYRDRIQRNPLDVEAHFRMGLQLMRRKRPEEAGRHLLMAFRLDPGLVMRLLEDSRLCAFREDPTVRKILRHYQMDQQRRLFTGYA